ncbi:MAG: hypothetical protein ACREJC_10880, partial [Tepidisphaeraceae bacterium]
EKLQGPGLPHYISGRLSEDRSRSVRHSFRMDLNGGSIIYRYEPGQIKVQRGAHYRVQAFVQTTPMPNARACLTAYFTDLDGHQISSSVTRSELYSALAESDPWRQIGVELSADDPDAAFLVLELGLLQPAQYARPTLGQRTLYPQDIHGTAWFDDVTVSQVPQVTLSTQRPGNIFRRGDPLRLTALVNDRFTDDLAVQLVVRDADGRVAHQKSGALEASETESVKPGEKRLHITLPDDLPPGWYQASLEMSSQGQFVGRQELNLVILADAGRPVPPDGRFGIIATDVPFSRWDELTEILPLLGAGRVKLAVWSDQCDAQQDGAAFSRLLGRLGELHITPTGCLVGLPPAVREQLGHTDDNSPARTRGNELSWLRILNAPPDTWQAQLAYLLARHANQLDRWQLCEDGSDAFVTQPKMREVYRRVHAEFSRLMQSPDLAMPWPAWYELDGEIPATVALHVRPDVLPSQLPLYVQDLERRGMSASTDGSKVHSLSIYLEPLNRSDYGREMQIRDMAQRMIYALAAGARRIDIKLPYSTAGDGDAVAGQPQELLVVVRTIMTTLSNATFKGVVPIGEGVEAFLFDRNGQGVLVVWDRGSERGMKQLALNLGERPQRVDLWGNVTPLLRFGNDARDGKVRIELGPMPVMLIDIDTTLAQLRASVTVDNDRIESSFKAHARRIRFTNSYHTAISGTLKLSAPKGWVINPPSHTFALNPGETFDREIAIEFPYNSFAGARTINAEFHVQADTVANFTVPIILKLGLSDVGLQTLALRDGKDVIVQQMITNYGEKPIDYAAWAIYPGQARQERLVTNLAPGRTTIKKYRFAEVPVLRDARVRSGVKELVGTRILNDEVAVQ